MAALKGEFYPLKDLQTPSVMNSLTINQVPDSLAKDIIGAAMEAINTLDHGLLEKPYENALCVEMQLRGLKHQQQVRYPVEYKGVRIGEYIPDLIANDQVVVEAKTIDRITDHDLGQMLNYLRITGLSVGLIIKFKRAKLEWKRVSLSDR